MKCKVTVKGQEHQSTEFTERHVTGLLSGLGSWGINLKEFFEAIFAGEVSSSTAWKQYSGTAFREFSMRQADENMSYVLEAVFPTLKTPIGELDTADLCEIANPMIIAWGQSLQPGTPEPIEPTPSIVEPASLPEPPVPYGDDFTLTYPEDVMEITPDEVHAIGKTSRHLNHSYALVDCWFQWWKMFDGLDSDPIGTTELIELIIEQTGDLFDASDCERYHALTQAYLSEASIAA